MKPTSKSLTGSYSCPYRLCFRNRQFLAYKIMSEDDNLEKHPQNKLLDPIYPEMVSKNESQSQTAGIVEKIQFLGEPIALDESSRSNIKLDPRKILSELLKNDAIRNNPGNAILDQIKEIDNNTALSLVSSPLNAISAESSSGCYKPNKKDSGIRCIKPESCSVNPTPDSK